MSEESGYRCRRETYRPLARALLCATLLGGSSASADRLVSYSASAFDLESGEPLYVERHVETWREGRLAERRVRYEAPDGDLIASKEVRYGATPAVPSFEMIDHRLGLLEGAEVGDDSVVLFSGPATEDGSLRREVPRPESAVVDAGFDAFMRANFEAISRGERLEFDFAVPAARRFVRFELVPEGEVRYRNEPAYLVRMRPASVLLRLAVDPIELVYSPEGRLLEFRGLSNVCDERGDRHRARIVFDYPERGPTVLEVGAAR